MRLTPGIHVSRRRLLHVGYLSGLGLSIADYLRLTAAGEPGGTSPAATADAVIFVHLAGGPSHLDTLDMKPDAPTEERSPFRMIDTKIAGLKACEHLPKIAAAIDRFALLRGISHSVGGHLEASQFLFTGNRPNSALRFPSMGSVLMKERPSDSDIPSFVAVPRSDANAGFLGVEYSPFMTSTVPTAGKPFKMRGLALTEGMTLERFRRREALRSDIDTALRDANAAGEVLNGLDYFGEKAMEMILSPRAREAFDVSRESPLIARLFAANDLGQSCLLAVRLIERGVRFVTIADDGWDTHQDNFEQHRHGLLPPLDAAAPAIIEALHQKGLLERTMVVISGEFGRTPTVNKQSGRDHWPHANWTLVTGGGVRPGQLIGSTDRLGHGPDDATHIKPDDVGASIYRALGIDHKLEYRTTTGRPVVLVQHGEPIDELFQ